MAVEILVRAISSGDALKGNYLKGFPVVAMKIPWNWGGMECPPDFVIVNISNAQEVSDINHIIQEWRRKTSYEILDFDETKDFFQVHIFADKTISTSHSVAQVTTINMIDFLTKWGATSITDSDGGVVFDITAFNAIKNRGLFDFGTEEDFCKYTEVSYDPSTGIHTIELDYTLTNLKIEDVLSVLRSGGMEIVSYNDANGKCIFTGVRENMIKKLETQVSQKFDTMIARTRYRFSDAIVDQALSASDGKVTLTLDTLDDNIVDVSEEV